MAQTRMPVGRYTKKLLRLPEEVLEVLEAEALQQERSLNGQIVHVLREWCQPKPACPEKTDDPASSQLVGATS